MSTGSSSAAFHTLQGLRDVPGVLGSFLWDQDGRVIAADLKPPRADVVLQAVAARLQRLVEAHANAGECLQSLTVRFDACRLHICGVANASLAVVLSSTSQLPALRLALGHVLRELSRLPELAAAVPSSAAAGTQSSALASGAQSPVAAAPGRSYRGHRITE